MRGIIFSRLLALFLGIFLVAGSACAQDIIFKKDGTKIEAKIVEVGSAEVKYRKQDNPDGPVYTIRVAEILVIDYANGTHDSFANTEEIEPTPIPKSRILEDYGRFMFNVNVLGLLVGRANFGAEYLVGGGVVGLHAHGGFGVGPNLIFRELKYNFGLEVRAYPLGQTKATVYLGPGYAFGEVRTTRIDFPGNVRRTETLHAFYLMHGVLINLHKNFNFSFGAGLGFRTTSFGRSEPYGKFEGNLILRL